MSAPVELQPPQPAARDLKRVASLFGGNRVLQHRVSGPLDAHEMLLQGLPGDALRHLVDNLQVLQKTDSLEKAVGMSLRTFQRHKDTPDKPLNKDQSGRAWKFAEILIKATSVFGSQKQAELWLEEPAMGLDQRRPIDLLATQVGVEIVEEFLERLDYCVYT
jgi:putative toxin-antitoxin system antitoxin component (TIGR02293 family)